MRQRALIAMALACRPRLLIADEPTTALDVTIQAQILALLKELVVEHGTALIMITHDLGVVAGLCDTVNVLYAGRVVERADRHELFAIAAAPVHRRACSTRSRGWTPPPASGSTPIRGSVVGQHPVVDRLRLRAAVRQRDRSVLGGQPGARRVRAPAALPQPGRCGDSGRGRAAASTGSGVGDGPPCGHRTRLGPHGERDDRWGARTTSSPTRSTASAAPRPSTCRPAMSRMLPAPCPSRRRSPTWR